MSDAIGVLKNVGGQIGEEFGVEESDWNLNDLIGAGEGIVGKYKERASVLVTSGTGLVEQLVKSDEGQEIKKESESLLNAISNSEGANKFLENAKKLLPATK